MYEMKLSRLHLGFYMFFYHGNVGLQRRLSIHPRGSGRISRVLPVGCLIISPRKLGYIYNIYIIYIWVNYIIFHQPELNESCGHFGMIGMIPRNLTMISIDGWWFGT